MERIIIDTDPGIDDAFAIMLAGKSKEFKIEGITTVAGNCGIENATENAFKILDMINRNDIKVYKGMARSLVREDLDATDVHGTNGLGGVEYTHINRNVEDKDAIDYLIETVNSNPGEITIVPIGALTNIACAVLKDSNFVKNVKELVIMGGAENGGNISPYAEFNFYKDPDAAKIVFEAGFKNIIMVGLDVTTKLPLLKKYEDMLENMDDELANFLFKITRTGAEFDRSKGYEGSILNDPLTIAYLLDRNILTFKDAYVEILTEGEKIGKSVVKAPTENLKANCKVAIGVDSEEFYKILFKRIINVNIDNN